MGLTLKFDRISLVLTGFYPFMLSFNEFHRVSLVFTVFSLDLTKFYRFLPSFTE